MTVIIAVAMLTLAERKVIGYMQLRIGPNRVTFFGLKLFRGIAQPFADVFKLVLKEIIVPDASSRLLFLMAPLIVLVPALATWAVVPFSPEFVLADINAGLLYVLALTSLGVYGVILAGWASNSKYAFLGAMRSAAQMVAYEIAMGFALVGVLMAAGSLNLGEIVRSQQGGFLSWNWFWLFPLFIVYFVSGLAETNRAPFDVAEGESEIVAGFHVEYSGRRIRLAVRAARVREHDPGLALCPVFFFGGWLSPFQGYLPDDWFVAQPGFFWLFLKTCFFLFVFLWVRATFPRYRYDQIMRLGWKVLIPVTLVWIGVEAVLAWLRRRTVGALRPMMKRIGSDLPHAVPDRAAGRAVGDAAQLLPPQDHAALPGGEDPAIAALPRTARAAPLSERPGALHRLQAVRGGLPGAGDHDRVRCRPGRHAAHDALRHRPVQVHLLRLLRGGLPGGCDRRDAHPRVPHGEPRREHHDQGQAARDRRALRGDDRGRQGRGLRATGELRCW